MKTNFTIFYSWQSDVIKNKNFISSNLDKAIRELKTKSKISESDFNVELNLDRDTQNKSGSPAIAQTIFDKISESDIFICDVSLINNNLVNRLLKNRLTPNPNVLIELGYAINLLGWERIICVNNLLLGETELLPFDLRGHRISIFKGYGIDEKKKITSVFKTAIKSIVIDYDNIVERHNNIGFKNHDKIIFSKINEIASEQRIKDTIHTIADSLYYNALHYEYIKSLIDFYANSLNHFININIHLSFIELTELCDRFISLCFEYIIEPKPTGESLHDLQAKNVIITETLKNDALQNERYFYPKEPFRNEDWDIYHQRHLKVQQEFLSLNIEIEKAYKNFVSTYKKETL